MVGRTHDARRAARWRTAVTILAGSAVVAVLSIGMPPRTPDFVWRGPHDSASRRAVATFPGIAHALRETFGLPLPPRVVAHAYDTPDGFARALSEYALVTPDHAAELAGYAAGVALPGMLLLRQPRLEPAPSPHWMRLVAHELTHLAQIELAGGESPAPRWLAEGMADWVAYGIVGRTVPAALEAQREAARDAACATLRAGTLDPGSLAAARAFVARAVEDGALPTYRIAFFLVDDLVRKAGFEALVTYFALFRASPDAPAHFAAAFNESVASFERAAVARASVACVAASPIPS